jgi:hypothetical protein
VIDVEPLPLQGELAAAGPLPMNQLVARKDGWVVAGWRKKDPVVYSSGQFEQGDLIEGEVIEGEIIGGSIQPVSFTR